MADTNPIRSIKNQYHGINAHLHSLWQGEGGWSGFHTVQIGHLLTALKAKLRPLGYTADVEQSLQIRRIDDSKNRPRPDVMIYDPHPFRPSTASHVAQNPLQTIPLLELLDDDELSEKPFRSIVIYEADPVTLRHGEPVAWLELLSPSNKGDSQDADAYRAKRMDVLVSGLVFVELDYLNETPPTFPTISPAYPYRIIVIDPRPQFDDGQAQVLNFEVDEPIPTAYIPLNRGDILEFDFGLPYQRTFEESFYGDNVDYRHLPVNFDHYGEADQLRIVKRMLTVIEAAQRGTDLEQGLFSVTLSDFTLAAALEQLRAFQ